MNGILKKLKILKRGKKFWQKIKARILKGKEFNFKFFKHQKFLKWKFKKLENLKIQKFEN